MKRDYLKPSLEVVEIRIFQQLMAGSIKGVESNSEIGFGGSGGGMKPNHIDFEFEEFTE